VVEKRPYLSSKITKQTYQKSPLIPFSNSAFDQFLFPVSRIYQDHLDPSGLDTYRVFQ